MEEKFNKYLKNFELTDNKEFMGIPSNEDFELIKPFVSEDTKPEDLFVYKIKLCDNEVDRDYEQFSETCLNDLASLFYGKPGVYNHNWDSEGIHSRLYKVIPVTIEDTLNSQGEPYKYLEGYAYTIKENQDLINFIKRGLKREVSVGMRGNDLVCSVCGESLNHCNHIKGNEYEGKLCYGIIPQAEDAYEFSFVAVNSQKNASVEKDFKGGLQMTLQEIFEKISKSYPDESSVISKAFKELGDREAEINAKETELAELKAEVTRLTDENNELKGCVERYKAEEEAREYERYISEVLDNLEFVNEKAAELGNMLIDNNKELEAKELHNVLTKDYPFLFMDVEDVKEEIKEDNIPEVKDEVIEDEVKEDVVEEEKEEVKEDNIKEKEEDIVEEEEEEVKEDIVEEKEEIKEDEELKEIVTKKLNAFKAGKLNVKAIQEKMSNNTNTNNRIVSGMKFN